MHSFFLLPPVVGYHHRLQEPGRVNVFIHRFLYRVFFFPLPSPGEQVNTFGLYIRNFHYLISQSPTIFHTFSVHQAAANTFSCPTTWLTSILPRHTGNKTSEDSILIFSLRPHLIFHSLAEILSIIHPQIPDISYVLTLSVVPALTTIPAKLRIAELNKQTKEPKWLNWCVCSNIQQGL